MGALSRFGHICVSRRETNVPIRPMKTLRTHVQYATICARVRGVSSIEQRWWPPCRSMEK